MTPILSYVLTRALMFLLSIWGAFTLAFFFFHLIPGDPVSAYLQQLEQQFSQTVDAADAAAMAAEMKARLGIDGSLPEQYWRFLGNVFIRFDLGPSFINFPKPAMEHILEKLPWTLWLLGTSTIISWILGFVVGGIIGTFRNNIASQFLINFSLVISQIPSYFTALFALFLFGYWFVLLPTKGAYDPGIEKDLFNPRFLLSVARYAIMPAMAVVMVGVAGTLISTRSLVTTILGDDYLQFAHAKGLRRSHILMRYVLRNAMLPQITGLALSLGFVLNGFYLVEIIFNYPGMGSLFLSAIRLLDYNLILGIVLMSITVVLAATFIIDLFLPLIDPRIKLSD